MYFAETRIVHSSFFPLNDHPLVQCAEWWFEFQTLPRIIYISNMLSDGFIPFQLRVNRVGENFTHPPMPSWCIRKGNSSERWKNFSASLNGILHPKNLIESTSFLCELAQLLSPYTAPLSFIFHKFHSPISSRLAPFTYNPPNNIHNK